MSFPLQGAYSWSRKGVSAAERSNEKATQGALLEAFVWLRASTQSAQCVAGQVHVAVEGLEEEGQRGCQKRVLLCSGLCAELSYVACAVCVSKRDVRC
jgi:hypothetical protein